MTMLEHMPPLPQSKLFKNSISSFFRIHPTLQTWHQVITIFGSLKKALRRRRFGSDDEEVTQAVHTWLCDQSKTFFSDGIKKFVERCKKCVDKQGDCVEK
jgi:hypothetical protein